MATYGTDWQRPIADLSDVPVERGSMRAMMLAAPVVDRHKPYTYRGTGEDQHPAWTLDPPAEPKPKPRPKGRATRRKPRRQARFDTRPRLHYAPRLPDPPWAPPTKRKIKTPIRPASGWQPLTGADLDAILDELQDPIQQEEP